MAETSLKIETIEGESTRKGLEGEIAIESYHFGASNPAELEGGGLGAGEVTLSTFNFTKKTDKASAPLFQACCGDKHVGNAVVKMFKSAGDEALNYLTITLEDAKVDDINWAGGNGVGSESVSLSFKKASIEYQPQESEGIGSGPIIASWNVKTKSPE